MVLKHVSLTLASVYLCRSDGLSVELNIGVAMYFVVLP